MKAIVIALVTLLLAAPVAAQEEPRGHLEDLRAARLAADGPIVRMNGNTCFVSLAWATRPDTDWYKPRCRPSRPEYRFPWQKVVVAAAGAIIGAGVAGVAFAGADEAIMHVAMWKGAGSGAATAAAVHE